MLIHQILQGATAIPQPATSVQRPTTRSLGILAATDINLSGSWSSFWGKFQGSIGSVMTLITMVGMLLVVGSVLKWLWDRRRGGGGGGGMGGANTVIWTLLLGATLAAPNLLIPVILTFLDAVANAFVSVVQT